MKSEDTSFIHEGERLDDLQRNGLSIIQHPGRFCFGVDAVLLSHFARAKRGEKVLDLCTGTGIIPILMSDRYPQTEYTALEIIPESAELARRSVQYNHLEQRIRILTGDLCETERIPELSGTAGRWDVITVNPPYMKKPCGAENAEEKLSMARHEISCTLDDVCRVSSRLLKSKGRMYMCHRPLRLAEIISTMKKYKLEPKTVRFCHARADREASIVFMEGVKDAGEEIRVLPPLIIYQENGQYTSEIRRIYYG